MVVVLGYTNIADAAVLAACRLEAGTRAANLACVEENTVVRVLAHVNVVGKRSNDR